MPELPAAMVPSRFCRIFAGECRARYAEKPERSAGNILRAAGVSSFGSSIHRRPLIVPIQREPQDLQVLWSIGR